MYKKNNKTDEIGNERRLKKEAGYESNMKRSGK